MYLYIADSTPKSVLAKKEYLVAPKYFIRYTNGKRRVSLGTNCSSSYANIKKGSERWLAQDEAIKLPK